MSPDDYLERLLDAVDKNNLWDVEAYSQLILDQIHHVKPEYREDLKSYLNSLISSSQEQAKIQRDKENLIAEIMKPK
jgi:hypothetical protein